MSKQVLFDDDSEEEVALKTENEYAKKYDKWREKEELHKLEQKYGSKPLNSDGSVSTDSEDESDEPPEVTEEMETQFLKTLALLKTKDPRIYDPQFKCFEDSKKKEPEKETKTKTLTFADSDDDDDNEGNIFAIEKKAEIVDNSKKQRKTSETKEGKLKEYLTGQAKHIDDEVEKDLAPLKALWSDPKLNEGEAFLRDYILNKRYLEDGDIGEAEDKIRDDEELEADEQRVEEQGKFERAYNFRFEEPDQEYLKRYPRTMNYIRPKDDSRARKRAELRSRKDEEKQRKMDEIARLKALKLKEIHEKIAKIKEVTGNDELGFKEEDLESEFDPEEHDKRMKEIFDEEYYGDADDQKPVFPDLDEELEIENWDKYEPGQAGEDGEEQQEGEGPHCEDEDFNMDADYDPKKARENLLEEVKKTLQGKKRRNRKKKSKLAQLLESDKPKFVPTVAEKTYDQYMEEYYKMDCEDIIGGDLPTRFKYREVVPNDYGLTVEEILLADDKELTQWVPLKKILKHRPDNVEKGDAKTYAMKAADTKLKKKILPSLFKDLPEDPEIVVPVETTKKKKKKKKKNNAEENANDSQEQIDQDIATHQDNETESVEPAETTTESPKKKKKHKNKDNTEEQTVTEDNSDKKKKKHKVEDFVVEDVPTAGPSQESAEVTVVNKKKNKAKQSNNTNDNNVQTNGNNVPKKKDNLKRKASFGETEQPNNKKKKNNKKDLKNKKDFKNNKQNGGFKNKGPMNPLVNLSDERLKAYGLNPKKYKNFLHFKKY
ncbi:protein KRI1 homolog [Anticarsia gemmatalis]|uniref:protein KRI1 homolog n=1 Tax=Anticarsia gemmatalis TaxID=129554 RepID=UPI003F774C04